MRARGVSYFARSSTENATCSRLILCKVKMFLSLKAQLEGFRNVNAGKHMP